MQIINGYSYVRERKKFHESDTPELRKVRTGVKLKSENNDNYGLWNRIMETAMGSKITIQKSEPGGILISQKRGTILETGEG